MQGENDVSRTYDEVLTIAEETYGGRLLDPDERDRIQRSLCPACGAWKNWDQDNENYLCNSCGALFVWGKERVYRVLGKLDSSGRPVDWPDVPEERAPGSTEPEQRFNSLLKEIDPANSDHWLRKFSNFREGRFNNAWNWPSFFFGPYRYFLKGMYVRAILYMVPVAVVYQLMAIELGEGNPLGNLLNLGWGVFFAVRGSHDYFLFCVKYENDLKGAKKSKKLGIANFILLLLFTILGTYVVGISNP